MPQIESVSESSGRQPAGSDALHRQLAALKALNAVASLRTTSLHDRLREALAIGAGFLGLDFGIVSEVRGETYTVAVQVSPPGTLHDGQDFPLGVTYCAITLSQCDEDGVVAIDEMGCSPHLGHPCYQEFGLEAYIGAPVIVDKAVYGTLNFSSAQAYRRPFDDGDREFVSLMARWVGAAIERDRGRCAVANSESRLRAIFDTAPECFKILGTDGTLQQMNAAGLAMVEADSVDQIVGTRVEETLVCAEYRDAFAALNKRALRGESGQLEFEIVGLRGTRRWMETRVVPLRDGAGGIVGVLGVSHDISERLRVERALRDGERTLREAQEIGRIGSYTFDIAADRWSGSPVLDDIFGIDEAFERSYSAWLSLVHPDDRAAMDAYFRDIVATRSRFSREYRIVRPADGGERWVYGVGEFVVGSDGPAEQLVGVIQDITQRRNADAGLRESQRRVRALLDAAGESTMLLDPSGIVLEINTLGADRFGKTPAEMIGTDFFDLLPPALAEKRRAAVRHVAETGEPLQTSDLRGGIHFENLIHPVKNERGVVESVAVYAKDVTEQWRTLRVEDLFHRLDLMLLKWQMNAPTIAQMFCDGLLPLFDLRAAWVGHAERDGTLPLIAVAEQGTEHRFSDHLRSVCRRWREGDGYCITAGKVVADSQSLKLDVAGEDCATCSYRDCQSGLAAALMIPLTLQGRTWGVLTLYSGTAGAFDTSDLSRRLTSIAGRFSTSLEAALQQEWQALLETALESAGNSVFITDAEGKIIWVNQAFTVLSGYSADELVGATPSLFNSGVHDAAMFASMWRTVRGGDSWHGELVNARRDGGHYTVNQRITPLRNSVGEISHYVSILEDISERKAAEARIEHMANFDMLTGLPNRNLFFDRLGRALAMARRESCSGALLFIDLDRFKEVNDRFGHEAGDLLLKAVARRCLDCVRESDTVARLAGDEFTVLLPRVTSREGVAEVAGKIVAALARSFDLGGREAYIGASVGIALFPGDGSDVEYVLNAADRAMYDAKRAGRGTFRFAEALADTAAGTG